MSFLTEPNVVWVLSGSALIGVLLGVLGSFLLLRREALLGDAIAHAALPGVVLAFMITASRHPFVLMGGALVTCLLGNWSVSLLRRWSSVRSDSALAIVLASFFAAGIFLLTILQGLGSAQQSGLDQLLFGQAAGLKRSDFQFILFLTIATLLITVLVFERLKVITFDSSFAASIGLSVFSFELFLSLLVGLALVLSLQLVGIILVAAMLIIPPASARLLTDRFSRLVAGAGLIGGAAGVCGALLSWFITDAPTGPLIVLSASTAFLAAFLLSPRHGTLPAFLRRRRLKRNIREENILRALYLQAEEEDRRRALPLSLIAARIGLPLRSVQRAADDLKSRGEIVDSGFHEYELTETGERRAKEITRYHRLWETYLLQEAAIPPSHVHADAEDIEHFLTPELEMELVRRLPREPERDPHGKVIPEKEDS